MNKKIVFEFKIYTDGDCHNPIEYMEKHESQYFDNDFYEYTYCDDYDGSIRRVFDYEPDSISQFKEMINKICKDTTDGLHNQSNKEYIDEFFTDMKTGIFEVVDKGDIPCAYWDTQDSNVEIEWNLRMVETDVRKIKEVVYDTDSSIVQLSFDDPEKSTLISIRDKINNALVRGESGIDIELNSKEIKNTERFEAEFYDYFARPMHRVNLAFANDVISENDSLILRVRWKLRDDDIRTNGWYDDAQNIKLAIENDINHVMIKVPESISETRSLNSRLFNSVFAYIDNPMVIFKDAKCTYIQPADRRCDLYKLSWNINADKHANRIYNLFNTLGHVFDYIDDVIEGRETNPWDNNMRIETKFQLTTGDIIDIVRFMEERFPESHCQTYNYHRFSDDTSPKRGWDMEICSNLIHDHGIIQFKVL